MTTDPNFERFGHRADSSASGPERDRTLTLYLRDLGTVAPLEREVETGYASELHAARSALTALLRALPPETRAVVVDPDDPGPRSRTRWSLDRLDACYRRLVDHVGHHPDARLVRALDEARGLRRRIELNRDALVIAHLPLVIRIAKQSRNRFLPFLDLVQEGSIGLMEAVDRFDIHHGNRLATYAQFWIRRSVLAAIRNKARLIRLPETLTGMFTGVARAARRLRVELDREPTAEEIAAELGLPARRIEHLLATAHEPRSLDGSTAGAEGRDGHEVLPDAQSPDPLDDTLKQEMRALLAASLARLNPNEERVIRMRYGLDDCSSRSLREIGESIGLSPERVRQIEIRALQKLYLDHKRQVSPLQRRERRRGLHDPARRPRR